MKESKLIELLDLCLVELNGDASPTIRKIAIAHTLVKVRRSGKLNRFRIKFSSSLPEEDRLRIENESLRKQLNKIKEGTK